MRPAGLWPGAGQSLAPEGLRPDHRADLVAVDVDVSGMDAVDDVLHARVDAGVQPEGQAVALAVDVGQHAPDLVGVETRDVQHRPEHLALELADTGDAKHLRHDEATGLRRL